MLGPLHYIVALSFLTYDDLTMFERLVDGTHDPAQLYNEGSSLARDYRCLNGLERATHYSPSRGAHLNRTLRPSSKSSR